MSKENTYNQILNRIPLHTWIETTLKMEDYDNWDNGEYKGNIKAVQSLTAHICDHILEWIFNDKPSLEETKYYIDKHLLQEQSE
jgi:hypothetical protein